MPNNRIGNDMGKTTHVKTDTRYKESLHSQNATSRADADYAHSTNKKIGSKSAWNEFKSFFSSVGRAISGFFQLNQKSSKSSSKSSTKNFKNVQNRPTGMGRRRRNFKVGNGQETRPSQRKYGQKTAAMSYSTHVSEGISKKRANLPETDNVTRMVDRQESRPLSQPKDRKTTTAVNDSTNASRGISQEKPNLYVTDGIDRMVSPQSSRMPFKPESKAAHVSPPRNLANLEKEYVGALNTIHNVYLKQAKTANTPKAITDQANRLQNKLADSLANLAKANNTASADATPKAFTQFLAQYCGYLSFTDVKLPPAQHLDIKYNYGDGNSIHVEFTLNGKKIDYHCDKFSFEENASQLQTIKNFQDMQNHFIQINRCSSISGLTPDAVNSMKGLNKTFQHIKANFLSNPDIASMMPTAFDAGYCDEVAFLTEAIQKGRRVNKGVIENGKIKNFSKQIPYGGVANFVFRKFIEISGVANPKINFRDISEEDVVDLHSRALQELKTQNYTDEEISDLIGVQIAGNPGIPLGLLGIDFKHELKTVDQMLDGLCKMHLDYGGVSTGDELFELSLYYGISYPALVPNGKDGKILEAAIDDIVNNISSSVPENKRDEFIQKFKPAVEKYARESRAVTKKLIDKLPGYIAGKAQEESVIANMLLSRHTKALKETASGQVIGGMENYRFTPLAMLRNMINSWGMYVPKNGTAEDIETVQGDLYKHINTPQPYGLTFTSKNQAVGTVRSHVTGTTRSGREIKKVKILYGGDPSFPCTDIYSFTPNRNDGEGGGLSTGTRQKALSTAAVKDTSYHRAAVVESIKATILSSIKAGNSHLALTYGGTGINAGALDENGKKYNAKDMYPDVVIEALSKEYIVNGEPVNLAEFFKSVTLVGIST